MGVATYNRGSRSISREADEQMPVANLRADTQAYKDLIARKNSEIEQLKRDLARARRCLAATRLAHDERMSEYRSHVSDSEFAIRTLCRIAFPKDTP